MKKRNLLFKKKLTLLKSFRKKQVNSKDIFLLLFLFFLFPALSFTLIVIIYNINSNYIRRKKQKYNLNIKKKEKDLEIGNYEFKYKNDKGAIKSVKLNDINVNEAIMCFSAEWVRTFANDYEILSSSMEYDCGIDNKNYFENMEGQNFLHLYIISDGNRSTPFWGQKEKEKKESQIIQKIYFDGDVSGFKGYNNGYFTYFRDPTYNISFSIIKKIDNLKNEKKGSALESEKEKIIKGYSLPTYFFIKRESKDKAFKIKYAYTGSIKKKLTDMVEFNKLLKKAGFNYRRSTEVQKKIENSS